MNKYEKSILFVPQVIKILTLIVCIGNLVAPIYNGFRWHFSLFQIAISGVWIFAGMTATGKCCRNLHIVEDGVMLYEQNLSPVVILLGIIRIVETVYYLLLHRSDMSWFMLGILVVIDVLFLIFLYMDKIHYGYAKEITTEEILDVDKDY